MKEIEVGYYHYAGNDLDTIYIEINTKEIKMFFFIYRLDVDLDLDVDVDLDLEYSLPAKVGPIYFLHSAPYL